jgi:hypothetical protein
MKERHWYDRRKRTDAPADLEDEGHDKVSAWCKGYNDAVQAYVWELNATLRKELGDYDRT